MDGWWGSENSAATSRLCAVEGRRTRSVVIGVIGNEGVKGLVV